MYRPAVKSVTTLYFSVRSMSHSSISAAVSRRHCTLENNGEFLILVDEGSRNGTFIHGKRVPAGTKVALKHGSSFCVGTSENRITVC